jgi:TPR repeat protein
MDDLPVDCNTFTRLACCGKGMDHECWAKFQNSTMPEAQKSVCPQCRQKFPTTKEEIVKQVREWVDKGKAWAQTNLANKYQFGRGVPQSYEEAIEYYNMAIKQGDPNAMFQLATSYVAGEGVAQSFETAAELYALAANQGHARAQYNLGIVYANGTGVAQSYEKAIELFTLAANQGDADAQYNLGVLCYQGHGVAQSNDMARKWYLKAALQEHEDAINNLKFIDEEEGKTTPTLPCCATCGTPKTTRRPLHACSQCHTTQYCNRDCQMNHWRAGHKRECQRLQEEHEKALAPKEK